MADIRIAHLIKDFAGAQRAVDGVSLDIADGEFLVLVGPSGCGKSTLLRMIAGLEEPTSGSIVLGGEELADVDVADRDVAMVFQNYALYPHMTVENNLRFALKMRKTPKDEISRRVASAARILGLTEFLKRKPGALSGGQRQRVAMGRAIVREPKVFLMDEPLSNLDAKLRVTMRGELARLHERLGVTTVYVTHDQVEAMTLGDRVAVMSAGVLQQVDTPEALYARPANALVADFIGSPSMNLVESHVRGGAVEFAGVPLPVPDGFERLEDGRRVFVGVRPTDVAHADDARADAVPVSVEAAVVEKQGATTHVLFPTSARRWGETGGGRSGTDDEGLLIADGERVLLTACIDGARPVAVGDPVPLAISANRLHLFDAETGASLRDARPASMPIAS